MSLREYKRKRDFAKTPEPAGHTTARVANGTFVIQKHAASRLHYDFRLELDGVLKSWAVPKGPSLDPSTKSLAVQVEDHPLDYAAFEGIIPKGQYGGGTVLVWDRGTWQPEGDSAKALGAGKLKFRLFGEKLQGGWSLLRMSGRAGENGKNWLLIKRRDKYARPDEKSSIVTRKPRSVLSDRSIDEIAADADRVWSSNGAERRNGKAKRSSVQPKLNRHAAISSRNRESRHAGKSNRTSTGFAQEAASLAGARRGKQPSSLRPQLATLATSVPQGERWLHEIKFDGYRILAIFTGGKVRLITRQAKDWTRRFRALADEFERLPIRQGVLDGEIVALNEQGISEFQRLQNWLKRGNDEELICYLFDIPYCENVDLTATRLVERKALLRKLILATHPNNDGRLRYSDHIEGQGDEIWKHACRGEMEGVVSKLADSGYRQGRTRDWLKVKCHRRQEFVIAGFSKPSGARVGFGALLLGYYRDNDLVYCGRVGTGFTADSLRQLKSELKKRVVDTPPYDEPPTGADRRGVTWVKPELVGEVEFTEWTHDGRLRHPSFQGLREDKSAKQVVREEPKMSNGSTNVAAKRQRTAAAKQRSSTKGKSTPRSQDTPAVVAGVTITHPDRLIYQDAKLTKLDIVKFYEQIGEWILPHLVGRPLTLVRCPEGPGGECFYQKHLTGSMPKPVRGVAIKEKDKRQEYVVIDDLAGLISLVQMGVLEFHPWPAREDAIERPDRLVFDLDPGEGVAWNTVVEGTRAIRDFLAELGLKSFLRTSGGKGLHVVVPLSRRASWQQLKEFAKIVAETLAAHSPDRYVATMSKLKRQGKVFVDYLRNQRGATAVASYSTRSRPGAPVATPLAWEELSSRIRPDMYRVDNLPKRLESLRHDPWNGFFTTKQSLTAKILAAL
jgi:bifunctional non-homologous end joining protein LigD